MGEYLQQYSSCTDGGTPDVKHGTSSGTQFSGTVKVKLPLEVHWLYQVVLLYTLPEKINSRWIIIKNNDFINLALSLHSASQPDTHSAAVAWPSGSQDGAEFPQIVKHLPKIRGKRKNWKGFFTLPLLTDSAGYATVQQTESDLLQCWTEIAVITYSHIELHV